MSQCLVPIFIPCCLASELEDRNWTKGAAKARSSGDTHRKEGAARQGTRAVDDQAPLSSSLVPASSPTGPVHLLDHRDQGAGHCF